jgi:integrase
MPRMRLLLPRSRLAMRGWANMEPGTSYPPLTWELACAIAAHVSRKSSFLAKMAIGILLAFDCFLRVSELVNLRREDIVFAGDERIGNLVGESKTEKSATTVMVVIRKAKTGKSQWVELFDPVLIDLLRGLVKITKPGDFLFPMSTNLFRREFKTVCTGLGLSSLYVPHSLRHGGATRYKHLLKWTIESVMHRGRWASSKSARLYIQAGIAMAMSVAVPKHVHQIGGKISMSLFDHFNLAKG